MSTKDSEKKTSKIRHLWKDLLEELKELEISSRTH